MIKSGITTSGYKGMTKTKVIFRKFRKGDLIAIFPYEPGTNDPATCSCYQRVGQHGSCNPGLISITAPATKEEYTDLERELETLPFGYELTVVKRMPANAYSIRQQKLEEMKKG